MEKLLEEEQSPLGCALGCFTRGRRSADMLLIINKLMEGRIKMLKGGREGLGKQPIFAGLRGYEQMANKRAAVAPAGFIAAQLLCSQHHHLRVVITGGPCSVRSRPRSRGSSSERTAWHSAPLALRAAPRARTASMHARGTPSRAPPRGACGRTHVRAHRAGCERMHARVRPHDAHVRVHALTRARGT